MGGKHKACNSIPPNQICEICDHPAHGIHFDVISCRACAAFFRRTFVLNRKYVCRRGGNNCEIKGDVRYLCRLCRFNKCLQVGMSGENVQWNRDRISSAKRSSELKNSHCSPAQCASGLGPYNKYADVNPYAVAFPPNMSVQNPERKENYAAFIDGIVEALEHELYDVTPELPSGHHVTALERMTLGLQRLRSKVAPNPQTSETLDIAKGCRLWAKSSIDIAQCMMHCEEFTTLPPMEKMTVFKVSWCTFHRFANMAASLELFGEEVFTKEKVLITNQLAVDARTEYDFADMTNYPANEASALFKPYMRRMCTEIGKPMQELRLTDYELAYIMSLLVWNLEGTSVDQSTMDVADALRERISGELHDYYLHTLRLHNYADRLIQLMALVKQSTRIQNDKAKSMELARFFGVFKRTTNNNCQTNKFYDPKRC